MITDKDYAAVAAEVYAVDPLQKDRPLRSGETIRSEDFNGVIR